MQVRKAAVRILWEACIRVPDFSRAAEACVAVLNRVADSEESIQDLVGKVFHGLWFASKQEGLSRVPAIFLFLSTPSMLLKARASSGTCLGSEASADSGLLEGPSPRPPAEQVSAQNC